MIRFTTFDIKMIAIVTMIIDHIGVFFFPNEILFRIIGRIAFPLFAWMIANGAYHTHNIDHYLKRLFLFGVISEFPFILANQQRDPSFWYLNVFFTLFLGLLAIRFIKKTNNYAVWIFVITVCAGLANIFKADYGAAGVLAIVAFYLCYHSRRYTIISQTFIFFIFPLVSFYLSLAYRTSFSDYYLASPIQPYALFALVFLFFYRGKKGPAAKYLFYIIYPLQYVVFYLILKFA